ncbi:MAG TPA: nickel-dependent hydrogenase large subunit [Feifaniaceae bacterium]|nr:nickel-dependent hydrogenase large subunit [Feifaniaceae bacterium]
MTQIVVNPITRISGFLEISADVQENYVADAKVEGNLFRGFELMLNGRPPLDAVYFTQRICGICSAAHATASSMALEAALGVIPSEQGRYLRDFTHACDFIQNHIRHFYQFALPDFVRLPDYGPVFEATGTDFRFPPNITDELSAHYFASLNVSRTAHTMLAILGGKAPHSHGIFVGGITKPATVEDIIALKSMLEELKTFVNNVMVPDALLLAEYYGDYFQIGGGYGNFLSYGCFNGYRDIGTLYVDPSTYYNGAIAPLDPDGITESVEFAYYSPPEQYTPFETLVQPNASKTDANSWIKAPRYFGVPFEVGPLARQWLCGEYRNGVSVMDRTLARVYETRKLLGVMQTLLDNVIPETQLQTKYTVPEQARGMGLVDTSRGALGHWVEVSDRKLSLYQIITPSAWNLSSYAQGTRGAGEQALIGAHIADVDNPVEIGRIIRSFDPCVSCGTHVFTPEGLRGTWIVVP